MPTPLPHSRFLQEADWETYPEDLRGIVTDHFEDASQQHDARRLEYLTALGGIAEVWDAYAPRTGVDIGGAGSPFSAMVGVRTGLPLEVIDPALPGGMDLHTYLGTAPRLAHIISCISVLEHVDNLTQTVHDLGILLAPGGVLAITVDAVPELQQPVLVDTFHFHWMRKRIFNPYSIRRSLLVPLLEQELEPLGPIDYHRPVVPLLYGYGFASLIMTKPR